MMPISEELKKAYQEMYEHTLPECRGDNCGCRAPLSCCDPMYCAMSEQVAKEVRGVDVEHLKTDHPTLPFMGENGCVLEPHLRPQCAVHTCSINGLGAKIRGEGADAWTKRYYELRERIDQLEYEGKSSEPGDLS